MTKVTCWKCMRVYNLTQESGPRGTMLLFCPFCKNHVIPDSIKEKRVTEHEALQYQYQKEAEAQVLDFLQELWPKARVVIVEPPNRKKEKE